MTRSTGNARILLIFVLGAVIAVTTVILMLEPGSDVAQEDPSTQSDTAPAPLAPPSPSRDCRVCIGNQIRADVWNDGSFVIFECKIKNCPKAASTKNRIELGLQGEYGDWVSCCSLAKRPGRDGGCMSGFQAPPGRTVKGVIRVTAESEHDGPGCLPAEASDHLWINN